MSTTDQLLVHASRYAEHFTSGDLPLPPAMPVAIVTCMDARVNPYGLFGLSEGDAYVFRNAGGVITDDTIRSLALSQRLLGTREIIVVHHTDCGLMTFSDGDFRASVQAEIGIKPPWSTEAFDDPAKDVLQSMERIRTSPFLPHRDVRGFVYDVHTAALEEVS